MKSSSPSKRAIACRFCLVFVLLLATAAWTVSVSAAREPAGQGARQTVVKPVPAPAAGMQQSQSKQNAADRTSAQKTAKPPSGQPLQAHAGQPAPLKAATPSPPAPKPASMALAPAVKPSDAGSSPALQPSDADALQPAAGATTSPQKLSAIVKKTAESLNSPTFTFLPDKALDPFVPFVSLDTTADSNMPAKGPLTPLQKMSLAEMERGLTAITWGDLGRKAVIEDSTGKGYIVCVGTPAGLHGGVITEILDDRVVVQQEKWNSMARKRVPQDLTIKLVKKADGKK